MKSKDNNFSVPLKGNDSPSSSDILFSSGWQKYDMGQSRRYDYNYLFDLYVRRRDLRQLMIQKTPASEGTNKQIPEDANRDTFNLSLNEISENPDKQAVSEVVSNAPMGDPKDDLTPYFPFKDGTHLPVLSSFDKYASLSGIRVNKRSLVIGYDTEYCDDKETGKRNTLSWQFSLIDSDNLVEIVFLKKGKKDLWLELALGRILDLLNAPCYDTQNVPTVYKCIGSKNLSSDLSPEESDSEQDPEDSSSEQIPSESSPEQDLDEDQLTECEFATRDAAIKSSKKLYHDGRQIHTAKDWKDIPHLTVTLLSHAGIVDISAFDQSSRYHKDLLKHCTSVQKGLITLTPVIIHPDSVNPAYNTSGHQHKYPVSLNISDTMCHAPQGRRSLKMLGSIINWDKITLPKGMISRMDEYFKTDPAGYMEYASNDAVICLLYAASLYGYNHIIPVTITSATARVVQEILMNEFKVSTLSDYDRIFAGLKRVGHGLMPRRDKPGYIEATSKEPISDKADQLQRIAADSYHGGFNACTRVGYYPSRTYDYDLRNAYPTAMCIVPDVDWEDPVKNLIENRDLSLSDFAGSEQQTDENPSLCFFGYIRFNFPDNIKYPCIPVPVDGIPVFPRTSDTLDGVYACGPEIYLALKLGAQIFCERGIMANLRKDPKSDKTSYSMRHAVLQLISDRALARKEFGKGSLEEQILKVMCNSIYGKMSQNVVEKSSWSALTDEMVPIGCSRITNPVSASLTTSIVRAELLAAINQCEDEGYHVFSVTTDGFITDAPLEALSKMDLFGFKGMISNARLFLTSGEDPSIWECKHNQNDLVNFTTRGNISLDPSGVCAHNSSKSPFKSESYEDRLWLMTKVLSRKGAIPYESEEWTTLKEIVEKGEPFSVKKITRKIKMDFDMKRKPIRESFKTVKPKIEGQVYEIVNFDTTPYKDVDEYRKYKAKAESSKVLRTQEDWNKFNIKADSENIKIKIRDMDWEILKSCIMGHRAGLWTIPAITMLNGEERIEWINTHNTSTKRYTENDWKNAGRSTRQTNMLPKSFLEKKLRELMDDQIKEK